jgi:drug/metabolite transporter (DMT)-like permease
MSRIGAGTSDLRPVPRWKRTLAADLGLIGLCAIWGTSFPLVKSELRAVHPMALLTVRFSLAAIVMAPFVFLGRRRMKRETAAKGSALGVFLFAGMAAQTVGLQFTTASNSGFLTAMSVVLVPIWMLAFERRLPGWNTWLAVLLAVTGVALLTSRAGGGGFNRGDAFTLMSAAGFSLQIIFIEIWVRRENAPECAWWMVFTTAVLAAAVSWLFRPVLFHPTVRTAAVLVFLGLVTTAFAFWAQLRLQPDTSATAAAVLFATEPLFAALFARWFIGERLSRTGGLGACLMVSAILVHELGASRK